LLFKKTTKNGSIHNGNQKYMCRENAANKPVSRKKKELINRLLIGQISLAGIARAVCVVGSWNFVNH